MDSSRLVRLFPFLAWWKEYSLSFLKDDLVAGITVALVLVPQSMAYAQLAGLPAYYGLYASCIPPVVAALFGSSRRLATGPVAVVSIMTAATLEPLATAGSQEFIGYAILLSLLVGLFQFALGILRLGLVVNLLSHPVIVGFTNAAAVIIGTSQLARLMGIRIERGEHYYQTMLLLLENVRHQIHWPTLGMGLLAMGLMLVLKRWSPRAPNVLVAVVVTTLLSWATGFEHNITVPLEQIRVGELPGLMGQLERCQEHIRQTNRIRRHRPAPSSSGNARDALCGQCHGPRDLDSGKRTVPAPVQQEPTGIGRENVLELHFMAGVLDQYIAANRHQIRTIRTRIHNMRLVPVRDPDGTVVYREAERVAEERRAAPGIFRIRLGRGNVDVSAISLVGGGEVIGAVPRGLPPLTRPILDRDIIFSLMGSAVVISILGFMEAISIAKAIAARTGCKLDPDQELIGQGLANMTGAFVGSYPVSGSFSRSAVNFQAGARTGMSSVFSSFMVLLTILFFTPLLYHLPQSVLAAIIILAVVGLFNVRDIRHAYLVRKADGIIAIITFLSTLVFAPHLDRGIVLGVALSLAVFFYAKMKPVVVELSLWKDGHFRSIRRFRLAACPRIIIIRFDGPLFFANISYLEERVFMALTSRPEATIIVFKCNGINYVDASGELSLRMLVKRLQAGGYQVFFSGLKVQIVDVFRQSGLLELIGEQNMFPTLARTLDKVWPMAHRPEESRTCPLKRVIETGCSEKGSFGGYT